MPLQTQKQAVIAHDEKYYRRIPLTPSPESSKPKLMEQVRTVIRLRGMSYRTEQTYCDWIKRFILFHHKRHPKDMGVEEIRAYLTHLVMEAATRFATALPRTCWKRVTTFAPCRNCSVTPM
jgi:hypothetical protein